MNATIDCMDSAIDDHGVWRCGHIRGACPQVIIPTFENGGISDAKQIAFQPRVADSRGNRNTEFSQLLLALPGVVPFFREHKGLVLQTRLRSLIGAKAGISTLTNLSVHGHRQVREASLSKTQPMQ